jgi:hypothetical protein
MTNPSENEPEQSNIMQLFQLINNPRHDDDHVTVLDLPDGHFESTDPNHNSDN